MGDTNPIAWLMDVYYNRDFWQSCEYLHDALRKGDAKLLTNGVDIAPHLPKACIFIKDDLDEFYYLWCRQIYRKTHKRDYYFGAECYLFSYYMVMIAKCRGSTIHYDLEKLQFGFVPWGLLREINAGVADTWKYAYTFEVQVKEKREPNNEPASTENTSLVKAKID